MKKILFTILTATLALSVQAQTLRTSYFMDKYANRHQRNPAMSPSMGYVNFPALGNLYLGLQSNMKLSDYLYPGGENGGLKTALHEDISSDEFLRKIGRGGEMLNVDANINVLGFGFYTKYNRFWSFDMNVKAHGGLNIPKDVFAFFKEMELGHSTYNWKDLNAAGRLYAEFALGHARDITILGHDFRMGAKIKLLAGGIDGRFMVEDLTLRTTPNKYTLSGNAYGTVSGGLLQFTRDEDDKFDGIETIDDIVVSDILNFGGALDLGVVYNMDNLLEALFPTLPLKGFTVSLGITDLGFISYGKSIRAELDKSIEFEGVRFRRGTDDDGTSTFKGDIDYVTDQLDDMIDNLSTNNDAGKISRGLRTTTNLGVEYSFFNDKMSGGLLWSTYYGLPKVFNEMTLSYNLRPVRWYSLSLSTSFAHGFFRTAGWAMNFTPKYGLNFFFGMDYVPFAFTPQYIPIHTANFNFNFGMSIPLGGNRSAKYDGTKRERRATRRAAREAEGLQQSVQEVYQSEF